MVIWHHVKSLDLLVENRTTDLWVFKEKGYVNSVSDWLDPKQSVDVEVW